MYTKSFGIKQPGLKGETMDSRELFGEEHESITVCEEKNTKDTLEENYNTEFEEDAFCKYQEQPQEKALTSEQIQQQAEAKAKKGNNSLVVAIVTVLFILVIGLCVYIAVAVSNMVPKDGYGDKEYKAETEDPWEEILGEGYKEEQSENQTENGNTEDGGDSADDTYVYPNHSKDTFTGPYYEDVTDCMDYAVSYDMERKFCNIKEPENNVNIHTSYIKLNGDIPGIDEINRVLEEDATYFAENYKNNKEDMLEALEGKFGMDAEIRSYVTYNTESMISVVIREDISVGGMYLDVRLKSYNINLDTGTILDNSSILDIKEGFGQEFRDRSNRQNGTGSLDNFSNPEIEERLTDKDSVIFFYTPLGAELGYNYSEGGYRGWITITMQDYEEYLRTL